MAEKKDNSGTETNPPMWEWLLAGIGVALIVGVFTAMIYRGATSEDRPPAFELTVVSVSPSGGGYVAAFKIRNLGSQTAASVSVEGKLERGGQESESATANLSYVPGNSEREGGLFFTSDPSQFDLRLRATGYEKP